MWDDVDKIVRKYIRLIIRKFRSLQNKSLVFDELNVMGSVDQTYQEVNALCYKAFLEIVRVIYKRWVPDYGEEMFELWLLDRLEEYDPVTKYIWGNELDRKRARLVETVMADILSGKTKSETKKDIETALNYVNRQFRQTADDIAADITLKAYEDMGVEKVKWITAQDEKVCEVCEPRDGRIYSLKDCPQWPAHYNCRCILVNIK